MNKTWQGLFSLVCAGCLLILVTSSSHAQGEAIANLSVADNFTATEAVLTEPIPTQSNLTSDFLLTQAATEEQEAAEKTTKDAAQEATKEDSAAEETTEESEPEIFPVILDGEELFTIHQGYGPITAQQRAEDITKRIQEFADNDRLAVDDIQIYEDKRGIVIYANAELLGIIFPEQAASRGLTQQELAQELLTKTKAAITEYRNDRTTKNLVFSALKAIIYTVIVIYIFKFMNRVFPWFFAKLNTWRTNHVGAIRFQRLEFFSSAQLGRLILRIAKLIRIGLIFITLYIYIPVILGLFPWTKPLSIKIVNAFLNAVSLVGKGFLGYLPNVFIIGVFAAIAYYCIRLSKLIFNALGRGAITLPGFYPEWARPTARLVNFLIYALAAVFIFPYLPAADSEGFQGVSIFLGALFTLGSTSAIANIVSGIILIYTRAFAQGDRVQVAGITGDVIDKTILSTRILTPNNEVITIPNASLTSSNIINYTAAIRDKDRPLILHTTITLGYDVPWRKVHEVLIASAQGTKFILEDPEPFVLQTSLDDFYVSYELKVFTKRPAKMSSIYSELHQNIQDKCNEAEIEIMSPHYSAIRDGHQITIPEKYLPTDYRAPGFRVESPLSQLFGPKPPPAKDD